MPGPEGILALATLALATFALFIFEPRVTPIAMAKEARQLPGDASITSLAGAMTEAGASEESGGQSSLFLKRTVLNARNALNSQVAS